MSSRCRLVAGSRALVVVIVECAVSITVNVPRRPTSKTTAATMTSRIVKPDSSLRRLSGEGTMRLVHRPIACGAERGWTLVGCDASRARAGNESRRPGGRLDKGTAFELALRLGGGVVRPLRVDRAG